jgi:hypothetical protein
LIGTDRTVDDGDRAAAVAGAERRGDQREIAVGEFDDLGRGLEADRRPLRE